MRPFLRAYIVAVIGAALAVLWRAQYEPHAGQNWQPALISVLLVLCIIGEGVTFQVRSGWATHAGTIPHIAAALLLPPGQASAIAGLGILVHAVRRRQTPAKAAFNTASMTLSAGAAALVVA